MEADHLPKKNSKFLTPAKKSKKIMFILNNHLYSGIIYLLGILYVFIRIINLTYFCEIF
jgi:hypothetical protein